MNGIVLLVIGMAVGFGSGIVVALVLRPAPSDETQQDASLCEAVFEDLIHELDERHTQVLQQIDAWGEKLAKIPLSTHEQPKPPKDTGVSPKVKAVVDLLRQGYSSEEVARQLGVGKGEVDLIIQLKIPQGP